jgi:non-specific serine/threonine protein kinase/serine/threonine-protein kinase
MGEVYRAEQTDPIRRTVALKVIKRGMDTKEVITRFEAERQALALMDHPCIAKVYEAGSTPRGRPYFVMEFVQGEPINTYCDRQTLTTRKRLELFIQLCDGVQHAHQKAVIHRDLKPSNVIVTIQGDVAVPKIIDFGVAKATAQKLTEKTMYTALGELIGTPEYMSPEQAEMTGANVDTRTDIYGLGSHSVRAACRCAAARAAGAPQSRLRRDCADDPGARSGAPERQNEHAWLTFNRGRKSSTNRAGPFARLVAR